MALFSNIRNFFRKGDEPRQPGEEEREESIGTLSAADTGMRNSSSFLTPLTTGLSLLDTDEDGSWKSRKVKVWEKGDVILNTYRVLDILMGGMGYVYIVEHMSWKVQMAVKCPNEAVLANRAHFSRVLREADAWIGLGLHPNIAFCYYVRQIVEVPNIFIEYVDGGNLRDWIVDNKCSELAVGLDLAVQFCNGMEHAHAGGMVHRDIKPENILISKEGVLKITDFGIAILDGKREDDEGGDALDLLDDDDIYQVTAYGAIVGSPSYMSPEQWEDSHSVDFRADIYSFGVCMYEIFCGKRPYRKSAHDAMQINETPLDPLALREDIPPRLAALLKRCVSLEPQDRMGSFADVKRELVEIYAESFGAGPPHADVSDLGFKADGLNNRAVSYIELGKQGEAEVLWLKALDADPQHLESNFNYGYLKWSTLELSDDEFVAHLHELESLWGGSSDYWKCVGWVNLERGDFASVNRLQDSVNEIRDHEFRRVLNESREPMLEPVRTLKGKNWDVDDFTSLAASSDGRYAVTGSSDGIMRLWDLQGGEMLRAVHAHNNGVFSVDISRDGNYAISGGADTSAVVWDIGARKAISNLEHRYGSINAVKFSPDGITAATGGEDNCVKIWNFSTGERLAMLEAHEGAVCSLDFSPDGKYLASGGGDNMVRLWELETGKVLCTFNGHDDSVLALSFSADGASVASAGADSTVRVWGLPEGGGPEGRELRQWKAHNDVVTSIAFSPRGQYLVSGGWDKIVRLSRVVSGFGYWQQGHMAKVTSVVFTEEGERVISSGEDGTITYWDIHYPADIPPSAHPYPLLCRVSSTERLTHVRDEARGILHFAHKAIRSGDFSAAYEMLEKGLLLPGYERDKEFMDLVAQCTTWSKAKRKGLKNAWLLRILRGHSDWVTSVSISADSRYVLSGSCDKTVRLWELSTGKQVKRYDESGWSGGVSANVNSVEFSDTGNYVVSSSWNNKVRLWDVFTGKEIRTFEGHDGYVTSACFANNERFLLSAGTDGTVRLWDSSTGEEIRRFRGHDDIIHTVAFSSQNGYILSSSEDCTIKLWDVEKNELVRSLEGHPRAVLSAAFSSDGTLIVSGGVDGSIRVWDVESGREVGRMGEHGGWISSVSFSPDGLFVLSGSRDRTLRLWRVSDGSQVRRFDGHTGWVTCARFSADGRYAVSGGWDNSVMVWEFDWDWDL